MNLWHRTNAGDQRVLVVEDDFVTAEDLRQQLESLGARVLGPVSQVDAALRILTSGQRVDAATVDVSLGSTKAFKVADALRALGIPFVFVTGHDDWTVPDDYEGIPRYGKPADARVIAEGLFVQLEDPAAFARGDANSSRRG